MNSEEYRVDPGDIEIREDRIEVVVVRKIGDPEHDPVEHDQERHLDQERKAGSERIDLFGFVESHEFHPDLCLVALVFFLEFLDLRLDRLHLLAVRENMVLRNQEENSDSDGYEDNRKPEIIPWDCGDEERKKVVDRRIEDIPEEGAEKTRNIAGRVGIGGLPVHGESELVFPRRLEELVERSETQLLFGSVLDSKGLAKLWRWIGQEIVILFDGEITTGVDGDARRSIVLYLDHRDIGTHVRSGSNVEDDLVARSGVLLWTREDPVEY